jgi:AcrR family transcriptional regulator
MAPTQAERTEATRAALIAAGRKLFGRDGFAATSIEELAREAGVTRGALYHHFDSKEALFESVFEHVEIELISVAARSAAKGTDAWHSMLIACRAFLESAADPDVQRIVSIDGPSVLGWAKWREIEERYALGALRASLDRAAAEGFLQGRDTQTLAYMLLGALTEATLVLASGARPAKQVHREVELLLGSLRSNPSP